MSANMHIRILGTRGTIPILTKQTAKYGGNTSSVYVKCGNREIILDGGTGILKLRNEDITSKKLDILITHCHMDHIMALPVFQPLFDTEFDIRIYGPSGDDMSFTKRIERLMSPPLWPVGPSIFSSEPEYLSVHGGSTFYIGEIKVSTISLRHPGGSIGYSIEYGDRKLAYMLDMENTDDDRDLLEFLKGSDIIICDGQYTSEEYGEKKGWGHSTHENAARIGKAVDAGRLLITHHAPERRDEELDKFNIKIKSIFERAEFAQEEMEFNL